MEKIEIIGVWWLPSLPDRKVVGTFRFEEGTFPQLELVGSLSATPEFGCDTKHGIILGVAERHEITLSNCLQTAISISMPGVFKEKYTATMAFSGFHVEKPEDLVFSEIAIGYPNLDQWLGARCVEYKKQKGEEREARKLDIRIGPSEPVRVQVDGAAIEFEATCSTQSDGQMVLGVFQRGRVVIKPETPQEMNFLWSNYKHKIERFLSFGVGVPLYPERISVKIMADAGNGTKETSVQAEVYLNSGDPGRRRDQVHRKDMVFSYDIVAPSLESAIRNWFDVHEMVRPVFDLYFGNKYNRSLYLDNQLLGVSQAIEVYHRKRFGGTILQDEKWSTVKDQLRLVIDGSGIGVADKKTLKDKMEYLNEVGFRKRIKELYDRVEDLIKARIPSKKKFAGEIVQWRNYLTHYSDTSIDHNTRSEALRSLVDQGEFFLETLLLKEIGFSDEQIVAINSRNAS